MPVSLKSVLIVHIKNEIGMHGENGIGLEEISPNTKKATCSQNNDLKGEDLEWQYLV